LNNFTVI